MQKENQQEMAGAILKAFGHYKKEVEDKGGPDVVVTVEEKPRIEPSVVPGKTSGSSGASGVLKVEYRIQVAASSKPGIDSRYRSLEDLEVLQEDNMYKFMVGHFSSYEAARPRLSALKASGFDGAFIVAYKDGQRIRA
jgi:N-acetylmuramoyl-L-alanine amidase